MKKFMRNILSIVVSAALLVSSTIPVLADTGHSHEGGTVITVDDETTPKYTITLTTPNGMELSEDADYEYGAYQIFSGTVPTNPESVTGSKYDKDKGYQNPGNELAALPITDIKWGNAFGKVGDSTWQDNIVGFVRALAAAPTGEYSYAFHDFEGFEDFVDKTDKTKLAAKYYKDSTSKDNSNVNFDKLAVEVADVLAAPEHQNHEWLQAFTDILGGYAQGEEGYRNKGFVNQYYQSKTEETSGSYKITVPAGYYMIRDLSSIGENESYSARMLFVASNVTQVLKESVPQLEKQIERTDKIDYETEAAGVGDVVTYKLTGTLPSNYDEYLGGYQYTFIDTLSDGLTLNEIASSTGTYVTVTVKGLFKWVSSTEPAKGTWEWVDGATATIPIKYNNTSAAEYTHENDKHLGSDSTKGQVEYNYRENYTAPKDGTPAKLEVFFPCLKEIRITGDGNGNTESDTIYRLGYDDEDVTAADGTTTFKSSRIYVTYTATVNKNAVVTNGNENTATLEYSDNPQSYGDTNTTTEDTATVYTFGLEITKVNASEFIKADGKTTNPDDSVNEKVVLENAEFALVRPKSDSSGTEGYQIAKFINVVATNKADDPFGGVAYRSIDEWEDLTGATETDLAAKVKEFLYGASGSTAAAGKGDYILKSDDKGNIRISGLNDDITYTMVEAKAPDGYATIDPFTFSLTAAKVGGSGADKDEYNGQLASVTVTNGIGDKDPVDLEHYVDITNDGFTSKAVSSEPTKIEYTAGTVKNNGIIQMLVDNFKYEDLPSTGGMGTYLYYIIGGGVILLAAVLFFLSRKKPAKTVK